MRLSRIMRGSRITSAHVIAMLALFVALGGSSYAAVAITGANVKNSSLTGADLKNESVTGGDVDNSSLTGSDIKSSSLTTSDVKDSSLLAADFKPGELPAGPAGPAGPQGPAGLTQVVTRRVTAPVAATATETRAIPGNTGEIAVGGGASITQLGAGDAGVTSSEPLEADGSAPEDGEAAVQWRARGLNGTPNPQILNVYVLCAAV